MNAKIQTKVLDKPCSECLFTKRRIVTETQAAQIVTHCLGNDEHFVCHCSSMRGRMDVCHTFFKRYKWDIFSLRLLSFIGAETITEEELKELPLIEEMEEYD